MQPEPGSPSNAKTPAQTRYPLPPGSPTRHARQDPAGQTRGRAAPERPSANGGDHQTLRAGGWPTAHHQFTFHLKPHQQEEHRHQRIVDPQQHVLVNFQRTDLKLDGRFQKCVIEIARHAHVGEQHRGRSSNNQDHAAGCFTAKNGVVISR